jgi:hypothetical protein
MTQRLLTRWFLTSKERGNPSSRLDARHLGGAPWTEGNMVRPLIHGATYFAELQRRVSQMRDGDLLMFVDWRGDPDERLTGSPDTEVGKVFADAARRGVDVRGLVWRSHWDRLAFSAAENRRLGDEINDAGGQCLLDMRVRTGGSHHQKFVVLRHGSRPELDIAFLGGVGTPGTRSPGRNPAVAPGNLATGHPKCHLPAAGRIGADGGALSSSSQVRVGGRKPIPLRKPGRRLRQRSSEAELASGSR